jgi:D-lactate dehydrogenase (cytochrome)
MSKRIHRGAGADGLVDLLSDESRLAGRADGVAQPANERELVAVLTACAEAGECVTVGGALTGITGGGVPQGGVAVNLAPMDRPLGLRRDGDAWFVRCQPGVVLTRLREWVAAGDFPGSEEWDDADRALLDDFGKTPEQLFRPDPTEASATVGGMAACNASGARSFRWGAMRHYVEGVRGVLVDGRAFALRRGDATAGPDRRFRLPLENGASVEGVLPGYAMPDVKNASGYYAADGMDLVDLFVGSEGTLAVLTELELRLSPAPETVVGVVAFLPDEDAALRFVRILRGDDPDAAAPSERPLALEYFDHRALDLLRRARAEEDDSEIPDLPPDWRNAVYVEFAGSAESVEADTMTLCEAMAACGGNEDATWIADGPREHERLKTFRHLVPETVNRRIGEYKRAAPGITKLGTDMAVPDKHLEGMLCVYREALDPSGLDYVVFGHVGDNHLHVNILPKDEAEYARGKELYVAFAKEAVRRGGAVSAEHGLGKLKAFLLPVMYGEEGVEAMRAVKRAFDPEGRLNRGNLFEWR